MSTHRILSKLTLTRCFATMLIRWCWSLDEVIVAASGNVASLESEANNSNAEMKVGNNNNNNKMQSFLKAASVTQKFKTQLANLMTCIEGVYHSTTPQHILVTTRYNTSTLIHTAKHILYNTVTHFLCMIFTMKRTVTHTLTHTLYTPSNATTESSSITPSNTRHYATTFYHRHHGTVCTMHQTKQHQKCFALRS